MTTQREFNIAADIFNLFAQTLPPAPEPAPAPLPDFTEPSPVLDPAPLPGEVWRHGLTIAFIDYEPHDRLPWRFSLRSNETGKLVAQGHHHTREAANAAALTTARALADQAHDEATEARAFSPTRTNPHD